ncbi:uncharacterized protein LOC144611024 [Rhinoraja longicauda]
MPHYVAVFVIVSLLTWLGMLAKRQRDAENENRRGAPPNETWSTNSRNNSFDRRPSENDQHFKHTPDQADKQAASGRRRYQSTGTRPNEGAPPNETWSTNSRNNSFDRRPSENDQPFKHTPDQADKQAASGRRRYQSTGTRPNEGAPPNETWSTNSRNNSFDRRPSENDQPFKHTPDEADKQAASGRRRYQSTGTRPNEGAPPNETWSTNSRNNSFDRRPSENDQPFKHTPDQADKQAASGRRRYQSTGTRPNEDAPPNETWSTNSRNNSFDRRPSENDQPFKHTPDQADKQAASGRRRYQSTGTRPNEGAPPNETWSTNSRKDSFDRRPSENDQPFKHTPDQADKQAASGRRRYQSTGTRPNEVQEERVPAHKVNEDQSLTLQAEKPSTSERKPRKTVQEERVPAHKVNEDQTLKLQAEKPSTSERKPLKTVQEERLPAHKVNEDQSLTLQAEKPSTSERKPRKTVQEERVPAPKVNEDQTLTLQAEKPSTSERKPRKIGTQEAEILHRHTLRNWSKNLKVVHSGDEQIAGTRLFEKFYTDLRVTSTLPEGMPLGNDRGIDEDVEPHELLKRNNTEIEETSTTLLYGTAGIGKSTLIQKIIHDWATKNIYKEFKYIFHFKFQILNTIKYMTDLNTLVLETYPYLDQCLECLWKDPKTILFIIDDLDRYEQGNIFSADGPPGHCIHPHSKGLVRDILNSLIHGRLVKGCSLLVTTRPWRLEALQGIPVTSTFHLTGFTPEKVKEYFHRHLGDEVKAKQLVQLLESSDTLGTLSTNPLFCSIIASLPEWSQDGESPMLTIAHTRVLSVYLTTIMGICGFDAQTSRQSLLNLGEEAYKNIGYKNCSFKAQSFSEVNQHLPNFTSAFMMETAEKDERGIVYKFTYTVLQNFVAALVKSRNTSEISLKMLLNEAYTVTDDRFNIFSRFLVGLSSRTSTNLLERKLGSISPDAPSSISNWIKECVKMRLSNLVGKTTQRKFLNLLHCLFEFGDPQLTTEALEPMRTIKFNQCSLNTFDCLVLSRTLICCGPIEELDLSSCGIKSEGRRYLEPVLCKCKVLRLKSNHLTDDCLESLLSAVQTNRSLTVLDVSNCDQDKQNRNEFTAEKLQALVQNCMLQRVIRWTHHEDTEHKDSMLDKASNILTIITE